VPGGEAQKAEADARIKVKTGTNFFIMNIGIKVCRIDSLCKYL
jgi:hypothetical protein